MCENVVTNENACVKMSMRLLKYVFGCDKKSFWRATNKLYMYIHMYAWAWKVKKSERKTYIKRLCTYDILWMILKMLKHLVCVIFCFIFVLHDIFCFFFVYYYFIRIDNLFVNTILKNPNYSRIIHIDVLFKTHVIYHIVVFFFSYILNRKLLNYIQYTFSLIKAFPFPYLVFLLIEYLKSKSFKLFFFFLFFFWFVFNYFYNLCCFI